MKKLHLICNSHLDPVWQWDWQEGVSSALATFYQAAQFADEFDYVFCHNEVLLYEYVEKYNPALFKRIQDLVKEGKWHIMGGWYNQPDCHLPCGESFVRQITFGQEYFSSRFGTVPTTAINFDSFGHTIGLVQILKKTGYDSYLFCRPLPEMLELSDNLFNWVGLDGSEIKACRFEDDTIYCSGFGSSKQDLMRKAERWKDREVGVALWGVGNHGGNPSRKDLQDVEEWIKTADYEIIHSTPENFFKEVNPTIKYDKSLDHCLIGCYASVSKIKKLNASLEQKLFETEKICAIADMQYGLEYNHTDFKNAERELLFNHFHDILSGTSIGEGYQSSEQRAHYAMKILDELYLHAFMTIVEKFEKAVDGTYPMFVFNPFPYDRELVLESEFLPLENLISDTEEYRVWAIHNGKEIPCQIIKESCNINSDRRKRMVCKLSLKAFAMARVDFYIEKQPKQVKKDYNQHPLMFNDSAKKVVINRETGLLESFVVNGKEYLTGGAFVPVMYDDIADPWGWELRSIGKNPKSFVLSKNSLFGGLPSVNVTEDGELLTQVDSCFECSRSFVKVTYKIYKDAPYIDVRLYVLWNETEKALKIKVPTCLKDAFLAQTAYGTETHEMNCEEFATQRFVATKGTDEEVVALYNKDVYSTSMENGEMYITLLRGVAYCAHPIEDRPLFDGRRAVEYVEQGQHEFFFRLAVNKEVELERLAEEFGVSNFALNAYPHGIEKSLDSKLMISNPNIVLKVLKKSKNGKFVLRLFNNYSNIQACELAFGKEKTSLNFSPFEVKTLSFDGDTFKEEERMIV